MPFYERQPYIQPLYQLVAELMRGEIRVPRFQRPGTEATWKPEQRGDLLDSLYRGFPVGTILLWSSRDNIATYEMIGAWPVPEFESSELPTRLLLDGHQRLSTLVQILGRGLVRELSAGQATAFKEAGEEDPAAWREDWYFDVADAASDRRSRDRFVLAKPGQTTIPATWLALRIVMDRTALNAWIRAHESEIGEDGVRMVDELRDRLREYSMPVAVLVTSSLEEATESFQRVNSSGTPMGTFHMVSALAYKQSFDLQALFADLRQVALEPIGWADVEDTDLLRVTVALATPSANPARIDPARDAKRINGQIIRRAKEAILEAVELLGGAGVTGRDSLPYAWQLIVLAVFFGRLREAKTALSRDSREGALKWFWLTTYGEAFSGMNSAVFDRVLDGLKAMVEGKQPTVMRRDLTTVVRQPATYDFRAARSTACALALARVQDAGDVNGPAHRALGQLGAKALKTLTADGARSKWYHLVIETEQLPLSRLRPALMAHSRGEANTEQLEMLLRIGFPNRASGGTGALLDARRADLAAREEEFVGKLPYLEWQPKSK